MSIIENASVYAIYENGLSFSYPCKVNTKTKEVFDIQYDKFLPVDPESYSYAFLENYDDGIINGMSLIYKRSKIEEILSQYWINDFSKRLPKKTVYMLKIVCYEPDGKFFYKCTGRHRYATWENAMLSAYSIAIAQCKAANENSPFDLAYELAENEEYDELSDLGYPYPLSVACYYMPTGTKDGCTPKLVTGYDAVAIDDVSVYNDSLCESYEGCNIEIEAFFREDGKVRYGIFTPGTDFDDFTTAEEAYYAAEHFLHIEARKKELSNEKSQEK